MGGLGTPNRATKSSLLTAPMHPEPSGLLTRKAHDDKDVSVVQLKEIRPRSVEDVHAAAERGTADAGAALPHFETIQRSFGRHDVSGVRAHTGDEAEQACQDIGAKGFATGNNVAFRSDPDLHTAAHEAAHVVQQRAGVHLKGGVGEANDAYERHADAVADRVVAGQSAEALLGEMAGGAAAASASGPIQNKEVAKDAAITGGQDWTVHDREANTPRWQAACELNLLAGDSSQYVKIVERRDFYKWFYEYSVQRGFKTRWALAARVVADGAHQVADMDQKYAMGNDGLDLASVELQGAMREGNQIIFDNVFPKLKALIEGPKLEGLAAKQWDEQTLSEEQALVQPMYGRMSPQARSQLDAIARKNGAAGAGAWATGDDKVPQGPYNNAGRIPAFDQPDLQSVDDRWKYGMEVDQQFTPGGVGYDPAVDTRPQEPAGYDDGTELAKVDTKQHLHELDAWLNPNRISRTGAGSDVVAIIAGLSPSEKAIVLNDQSADGWAYSSQFAQFAFISEAQVRKALPSEPAVAVSAFISKYTAEKQSSDVANPWSVPWTQ